MLNGILYHNNISTKEKNTELYWWWTMKYERIHIVLHFEKLLASKQA